jgi:Uma2 family endonuclease
LFAAKSGGLTLKLLVRTAIVCRMTALLEVPGVRERVHRMSVEEYHRAGETGVLSKNVELLKGIVFTKMPKSPFHELVADKVMDILLAQAPTGFKVRRDGPLTLHDSEPEPDVSVVEGERDDWAEAHPSTARLVVEVAVTSQAIDESKAEIYAEASVSEYWLVRPDHRSVAVYRQPTSDGYLVRRTFNEHDRLRCESVPGVEFPVGDILPRPSLK